MAVTVKKVAGIENCNLTLNQQSNLMKEIAVSLIDLMQD